MSLLRIKGGHLERYILGGDLLGLGETIQANATAGAAKTWSAQQLVSGILADTPSADTTATTDTADNIIAALGSNLVPGLTWRLRVINLAAHAITLAYGRGVVAGGNGSATVNIANSVTRDYLFTLLNVTREVTMPMTFLNASKTLNFVLPPGAVAIPLAGPDGAGGGPIITPGMYLTGTGLTTGTKVLGIIMGQGGMTGIKTDTNSTAAEANPVQVTFSPCISIDSLGSLAA